MRLTDLNPRWERCGGEGIYNTDPVTQEFVPAPEREGIGVSFDCPCGKKDFKGDGDFDYHRCHVLFENPTDGQGRFDATSGRHYWTREGDTFETLTLSPSIQRIGDCAWHGWIRNGEIINA